MKTAKEKTLKVAELGFGSADDITVSYLKTKGLKLEGIPYAKPGLRYTSILGSNADVLYEQTGDVRSYFDGGKIRPLIFFYPHRLNLPQFKNVPIGGEFGYDVTLPQFRAIVVKAGTDPKIVKKLSDELAKVAQKPEFKAYLEKQYADPDSFVPMDKSREFMDDVAEAGQEIPRRDQDGRQVSSPVSSPTEITPLRRLQAALPYVVVLAAGLFLYFRADNFEFEQVSGRIGPGAWPKLILVLMLATAALGHRRQRASKAGNARDRLTTPRPRRTRTWCGRRKSIRTGYGSPSAPRCFTCWRCRSSASFLRPSSTASA